VHLNFEENQEFNAFVYFLLSILNGKAIDKRDEQFFYFCKIEMLPANLVCQKPGFYRNSQKPGFLKKPGF